MFGTIRTQSLRLMDVHVLGGLSSWTKAHPDFKMEPLHTLARPFILINILYATLGKLKPYRYTLSR